VFAVAGCLTGGGGVFECVAERPHVRGVPPLLQRGVECRPAVLLDGESVGFRDGVLPPRLAFDVAAAALLGYLLLGKSRRGLPFLLALSEGGGARNDTQYPQWLSRMDVTST
jgi:hypothetical protein